MIEFIERHFDKLLLAAIMAALVSVVILLSVYGQAAETISWARELTSAFAGGLLGLITGLRMGKKDEGSNGDA